VPELFAFESSARAGAIPRASAMAVTTPVVNQRDFIVVFLPW
jgi:hypothetical protein